MVFFLSLNSLLSAFYILQFIFWCLIFKMFWNYVFYSQSFLKPYFSESHNSLPSCVLSHMSKTLGISNHTSFNDRWDSFSITYEIEVFVSIKLEKFIWRMLHPLFEEDNTRVIWKKVDLLEEIRTSTTIISVSIKQAIALRFDIRVWPQEFQPGYLMWRQADSRGKNARYGKLAENGKSPYKVKTNTGNRAYTLEIDWGF